MPREPRAMTRPSTVIAVSILALWAVGVAEAQDNVVKLGVSEYTTPCPPVPPPEVVP